MCDYNSIFKEIAQYRAMIAQAEAEKAKLEAQIKEYMEAEGVTELMGTEHKATYAEVTTNRFDTTAFKKDYADVYEAYRKPSTSMRFTFN